MSAAPPCSVGRKKKTPQIKKEPELSFIGKLQARFKTKQSQKTEIRSDICYHANDKSIDYGKQEIKKMDRKVVQHGISIFITNDNEEERCCPDCGTSLEEDEDSSVLFEHPKKVKNKWTVKCQCKDCGCVYVLSMTDKEKKEIENQKKEED